MKIKQHTVLQFAFLLNNITWLSFDVSKYKATSFYKKWLHGIPSCGNNTGYLNHPLPMGMWVVSNCFDTINDAVDNSVYISFCISARFSVEELPGGGIAGLWGKKIKHLSIYSNWPSRKS